MTETESQVTLTTPWDGYWRTKPRWWTTQRLFKLAGYLEAGYDDARIASRMGTTANAVQLARKRHGIRSRTELTWSSRRVAELLGIACSKTVVHWITCGYMAGQRGQSRGPNRQWYVRYEEILSFLENPDTHHLWQPERITDSGLRAWATEIWTGPFLTVGEVAERCFVGIGAVNNWIHKGDIPAVRNGNWLIRESDLDGFTPPNQRDRTGQQQRRFTPDEDALLLSLRSGGMSWPGIARHVNRTVSSVYQRHHLLVERGVRIAPAEEAA